MWVTLIGIVKRKTLRSRTTINTSGSCLQAVCKVETFLSGERGKNLNRIMFNLLPNVQNPVCQGGLTAFLCIHAFPHVTCVQVRYSYIPRGHMTSHQQTNRKGARSCIIGLHIRDPMTRDLDFPIFLLIDFKF